MKTEFAPIIIFAYNRPEHTSECILSLSKNEEFSNSKVFVYSDGPKNESDKTRVEAVRSSIASLKFQNIEIIKSDCNKGLANSVIEGVKQAIDEYERVIVLEDDLIVTKNFLKYMNSCLDKYNNQDNIMQISGFGFPNSSIDTNNKYYFLPFITSWGWGTWKRAWDKYDKKLDGWQILLDNRKTRKKFDLDGNFPYTQMLVNQQNDKINSWAIKWYWSVFKENGLVLYPSKSFVKNSGFDGTGVHCKVDKQNDMNSTSMNEDLHFEFPQKIEISKKDYASVKLFLRYRNKYIKRELVKLNGEIKILVFKIKKLIGSR